MAATHNEDRIAIAIYLLAAGQPITLGAVEQALEQLLAHPPDCDCGLCGAAATVRPYGVWQVVRRWQSGVAATRRRVAR